MLAKKSALSMQPLHIHAQPRDPGETKGWGEAQSTTVAIGNQTIHPSKTRQPTHSTPNPAGHQLLRTFSQGTGVTARVPPLAGPFKRLWRTTLASGVTSRRIGHKPLGATIKLDSPSLLLPAFKPTGRNPERNYLVRGG